MLTLSESNSPLWSKLREYYAARLETMRAKNDGMLTPDETSRLRGRIQEIKNLLALEYQAPEKDVND